MTPKASNIPAMTALRGISLIEIGMAMMFISLALVPVVQMVGGAKGADGSNVSRVTGNRSKQLVMANALIERGLARDYTVLNCGNAPTLPTGTSPQSYAMCTNTDYTTPMYYQWTIQNMGAASGLPAGNELYQAVLNVYDDPNAQQPELTLPTYFFNNINGWSPPTESTGISVVFDVSSSMRSANSTNPGWTGVASPFLKYRYYDPAYPAYTPPGTALNLNDNKQLDVVVAQNNDDPATPWDDRYMQKNILNLSDCTSNANYNSAVWGTYYKLNNNGHRDEVKNLCRTKANTADWENVMNTSMSRYEAARSALLGFLVDIEDDPSIYSNLRLGFLTFDNNVTLRATMTPADGSGHFPTLRRQFSWINRLGPGQIGTGSGTNMYDGVYSGAEMVFDEAGIDNRIIFVVGDGQPSVGKKKHSDFQSLADSVADGTFPGANGNKATIFTLGVIDDRADIEPYMKVDLADRTPGGQFFYAQNVADLGPVFKQIKYQIQKVILVSRANRYGIDVE